VFFRTGGERLGRDGARVPMPWERRGPGLGFTTGTPWLPVPPAWADLSVAAQNDDAASTLALYRAAIATRPSGAFAWRESPPGTLVFERDDVVCAVNIDGEAFELPGDAVLASEPVDGVLPPDRAAWLRR
jgi:alpha-glucosidase